MGYLHCDIEIIDKINQTVLERETLLPVENSCETNASIGNRKEVIIYFNLKKTNIECRMNFGI